MMIQTISILKLIQIFSIPKRIQTFSRYYKADPDHQYSKADPDYRCSKADPDCQYTADPDYQYSKADRSRLSEPHTADPDDQIYKAVTDYKYSKADADIMGHFDTVDTSTVPTDTHQLVLDLFEDFSDPHTVLRLRIQRVSGMRIRIICSKVIKRINFNCFFILS